MDITGALAAVLALAVYPGGITLLTMALAARRGGGRAGPGSTGWSRGGVLAAGVAALAAGLLPLPGSPARSLPPDAGADANLFAIVLLLAIGAGALPGGLWPGRGVLAAGLATAAVLMLSARAGSRSFEVVATLPGGAYAVARGGAALALVGTGLLLARGRRRAEEEGGRVALVVVCELVAGSLLLTAPLQRAPGVVLALAILAAGLGGAIVCLRLGRVIPGGACEAAAALAAAAALVASVVAVR